MVSDVEAAASLLSSSLQSASVAFCCAAVSSWCCSLWFFLPWCFFFVIAPPVPGFILWAGLLLLDISPEEFLFRQRVVRESSNFCQC